MSRATLALCLSLLGPVAARAQGESAPVDQVETLAARAKAHYAAGRFNEAISDYLAAFRLAPAAGLLYNVAHIYDRKLDEIDLALQFYRRYVGAPDAEPDIVGKANARIQELKIEKRRRELAEMAPPVTPPPVAITEPVAAPVARGGGSSQKTWGWITLGAGVAIAGAGAIFGVQAQGSADDFDASTDLAEKQAARDDGQSQALTADVLYGVGGAAVLTGIILLVTAPDDAATAWRLGPTGDGRGAALWLGGAL